MTAAIRWLRPPRYADEVEQARARLLHTALLTFVALVSGSLALSLARPGHHLPSVVWIYGSGYAIHLGALVLLHSGYLRTAALAYAGLVWLMLSIVTWLHGGVSGPHGATFVVCILIAGFCAGARWALVLTLLSLANAALLMVAERDGWLPAPIQVATPYDRAQALGVAVLLSGVLVAAAMTGLYRALRQASDREEARRRSLEELQASQRLHEIRARQGSALGSLGRTLAEAEDPDALFADAARVLVESEGFELAAVFAARDGKLVRRATFGRTAICEQVPETLDERSVNALETEADGPGGQPRLLRGGASLRRSSLLHTGGDDLILVVPGPEKARGYIWVVRAPGRAVAALDALFLETVAGMLGAALQREEMEHERRQAQKMEAVGRLASAIAHDFNNLLTGLIGAADLLAEELEPGDPRLDLVRDILFASDRASLLTKRLLSFNSRPTAKGLVDLGAAVRDFEPMLRRLLGEGVDLEVAVADGALPVLADRGSLDQVLLNLAVNARDAVVAAGRSGVRVKVARERGTEGPRARLSVSDEGLGMEPRTLERIFEPFFTTKEPGKGTGIGLSTVRTIVRELGGHIEATSAPGEGATFTVHLPLAPSTPAARVPGEPDAPDAATDARVLLVEDNEIVRKATANALRFGGYRVETAANGRQALERLDRAGQRIDLVLSDVVMPEMGGVELRDAIARRAEAPPVLLMSGFHREDFDAGDAAGAGAVIEKPFTPAQLLARVRERLALAGGPRRAEPTPAAPAPDP